MGLGPPLCFCSSSLMGVARTASRPCVFPLASMRAGHFLLLAQEKVTKEKGTLAAAVAGASMPQRLRKRLRRFADGTSLCRQRTRAHSARAPTGFFLRRLPRPRGNPGREKRKARHPPQKPLLLGPSETRRRADGRGPRAPHAGAREGSRAFGCEAGRLVSRTPATRSEPAKRARNRGCLFLWLLSFGQAKESDPLARMRAEKHTDVSRSSRVSQSLREPVRA